ncbi:BatD protein [Paraglaciecola sp. T6c]|uniref:BatD family protein n=1 Tax=Pseudoalteromonas atlantica (strain T6c / ATCC BAA-1087) TaxID=3042615 RepID=UPI00005C6287|nr:BatD family protein [Paraglaciecola sp. T6c]ABG40179.1 BatD protein [Paraglaciecola sp. T6c]
MQLFIRYLSRSCLFLWALSTFALAQIDELSATVDKNPVLADESITLSVVASGDASREAFDPSPLNADFIVGRTSVSSQTQMINFDTTRTTIWTTVLIPRKPGRFVIPAFTIEGKSSAPINMMVLPVSARQSTEGRDVYVTTSVDTDETYLQQQIRYTVKLFLARDLQRGSLSAPTLADGEIRQIGKDAEYNDIVDGKRYRVIERTFAVIPQKSGTFTIQGPMFEGEVVQDRQQSFGFFSRSKTINRVGPAQEITVKPIPANYSGTWLPSDYVELHEEWQPDASKFTVGEPITRTLTLTAVGVDEAQLPSINSQYPSGVKVYPNQPNTTTVEKDNTLIAQRTETIAIIPSQAGEFTLDEVSVPWFNIVSGQVEYATLPKRIITVVAGANDTSSSNIPPAAVGKNEQFPPTVQTAEQAPQQDSQHSVEQSISRVSQTTNLWFWLSCTLIILWVTTLVGWAAHVRRLTTKANVFSRANNGAANKTNPSEKQAWNSLQAAISKQDTQAIIQALTLWLNTLTGSNGKSINTLQNEFSNASLDNAISTLYASKFGAEDKQWNKEEIVSILSLIRQQASAHHSNEKLAPLY